jgi:hypothetical protein
MLACKTRSSHFCFCLDFFYLSFLKNRFYDDELALQHSLGNIHVNNRTVVYDFNPEKCRVSIYFSNKADIRLKKVIKHIYNFSIGLHRNFRTTRQIT